MPTASDAIHVCMCAVFGVREGIRDAERERIAQDTAERGKPVPAEEIQKAQKP